MKHYLCVATLSFTLLLTTSCTYNPFSTNNHLTGNVAGPVLGAGAGVITAKILTLPKPLVWLAGIGGAGLGYYVTTLQFTANGVTQSGGRVYTLGDYVTINIPANKLFEDNSSELLLSSDPILTSVVDLLNRYPDNNIIISGNTSGFSCAKFELRLSENRARQVATFLWAHGISNFGSNGMTTTRKLIYVGYGNYFPVANNITMKGFSANNRIQITSSPKRIPLNLDRRHKIFSNVGTLNGKAGCKTPCDSIDFNTVFPPNG